VAIVILQGVLVNRLTAAVRCVRTLRVHADQTQHVLEHIEKNTLATAISAIYPSSPYMKQRRIEEYVGREYLK
jgi:uncharacterized metal-binding protein